jgi:DHA2 family multidrug resistance protein
MRLSLLRTFDAVSFFAVMLGVGSLQYVLEEGARKEWLQSPAIVGLAWLSALCLAVVVWRGLTHPQPVLDLRAFGNRNFTLGCIYSFVCGVGLYGSIYIVPAILARVRGWNALQIGEIVFVTGLFQVATTPLVAYLARRVDLRLLLAGGLVLYGAALAMMTGVGPEWGAAELFWPLAIRGIGSMFIIVPITTIALGELSPERVGMASGLYNLMRNLGGAVGIAVIGVILQDQERLHAARLTERIVSEAGGQAAIVDRLTARVGAVVTDPDRARTAALSLLDQMVHRDALVMAFADAFVAMAVPFFLVLVLVPFTRRTRAS